jgi:hypothetical protein
MRKPKVHVQPPPAPDSSADTRPFSRPFSRQTPSEFYLVFSRSENNLNALKNIKVNGRLISVCLERDSLNKRQHRKA